MNREQGLFAAVLALVGAGVVLGRAGSLGVSSGPIKGGSFDAPAAPVLPRLNFIESGEARFQEAGRDVFQQPRDWNALAPLTLEPPPLPEVGHLAPPPAPGPSPEHYRLLRRGPPLPAAVPAEGASAGADGAEGGAGDPRSSGLDLGTLPAASADAVADEKSLERTHDWIRRRNQARTYGRILNDNRFGLLDDTGAAVRFQTVNTKTGKPVGTNDFKRADLEGDGAFQQGFGFADTVANRVALLRRDVRPGTGNPRRELTAARECLAWLAEDRATALRAAEEFVRSALNADPRQADGWELLADVEAAGFDPEGELAAFEAARAAGVESGGLLARKGALQRRLGLAQEAEASLRAAIELDPNSLTALRALADLLLSQTRATEALAVLDRAQKLGSLEQTDRLRLRVDEVRALLAAGDLAAAAAASERVLKMEIDDADALVADGAVRLVSGQLDRAIGSFRSALNLSARHRGALFDLGLALFQKGELGEASALIERSADVAPLSTGAALAAAGVLEEERGNLEQASDLYRRSLRAEPDDPYALYRAGRAARRLGDPEAADEFLRRALLLDGRITDVLVELGYSALLRDVPEAAEPYLQEALRREPDNRDARFLLGVSFARQNLIAEARAAFQAAAPKGDDPAALCGVAWCLYREGDEQGSIDKFGEARGAAQDPASPFAAYANANQARVDDHRNKEQWIDRFERTQLKNNWNVTEPFGPTVAMAGGRGIAITGTQRQGEDDGLTEVHRTISAGSFVGLEARIAAATGNEAVVGLRYVFESAPTGNKEGVVKGEIAVARFPDGSVRVLTSANGTPVLDWVAVEGASVPAGEAVTFAIERLDYDRGRFQVLVDGRPVPFPVEVDSMKKAKKEYRGGLFTRAKGRGRVDVSCDYVRVVRYKS